MEPKKKSKSYLQKAPKASFTLGDSNQKLDTLIKQKKKFNLILTSPPYNMNKEYETHKLIDFHLEEIEQIIEKLVQLLDSKGSICWQVGNYIDRATKELLPLDIFYYNIFKKKKLILRNRIIWHFEHGLHAKQRLSGRYETLLWFSKSNEYTFNLDNIRVPAKYPGKKYYKGEKKGQYSGNPLGKNPTDVWNIISEEWKTGLWHIPNVKANHKEKTVHPCQFPIELAERCILALTNEYDTVLDPYSGSGSTILAAFKNNRHSLGIEKNEEYIKISMQRLKLLKKRKLKTREIGTPIFVPNGNMSVAKKPSTFHY
jgi:adenine-specific DNA-methyltransferase